MQGVLIKVLSIEEKRKVISQVFKFKTVSLHQYIMRKGRVVKTLFRFEEILLIMKRTISEEGLYDVNNPVIVMCDDEMEKALNIKAFHDEELCGVLLKHLIRIDNDEFLRRYYRDDFLKMLNQKAIENPIRIPAAIYAHNFPGTIRLKENMRFTCKSRFLQILRGLPNVEKNKVVFTFGEIVRLLSEYIL